MGTTLKNQNKKILYPIFTIFVQLKICLSKFHLWSKQSGGGNTKVININIIVHPLGGDLFCPQHVMSHDNVKRTEVVLHTMLKIYYTTLIAKMVAESYNVTIYKNYIMQQDIFNICFFKFIFCITKNRIHPRE